MKKKLSCIFLIVISFWFSACFGETTFERLSINSVTPINVIPLYKKRLISNNQLCSQVLEELVLVKVKYWGFDEQIHVGSLIVHESLGMEVVAIFEALFAQRFPIQAMYPVPAELKKVPGIYSNISGAFSCREVTDQPGILSQHSYGRAIDINPLQNPYVKEKLVIPSGGRRYIDRIEPKKGKIIPNTPVTAIFTQYGWDWGGHWFDVKDFQHFEKRANGEKREPFGYPGLRFGMLYAS